MADPSSYPDHPDRNQYSDRNQSHSSEYHSDHSHNLVDYDEPSDRNGSTHHDLDRDPSLNDEMIHLRPATPEEIAYREGYTFGRNQEHFHEQILQKERSNSTAAGVAIGVLLATLAGMVLAMIYFGSRTQQTEQAPVLVPPQTQTSPTLAPSPAQAPVIERQPQVVPVPQQTEVIVPNPNQSNPTQPNISQPNISQPNTSQPNTVQPNPTQPNTDFTQPNLGQPGTSGAVPP